MKRLVFFFAIVCLWLFSFWATAADLHKIATWNMHWLGVSAGNKLDPVEAVKDYTTVILNTGATLLLLQEVGATHSRKDRPRSYYMNLIVDDLNHKTNRGFWAYELDDENRNQRLAFLYRTDIWELDDVHAIKPGSSFRYVRKPFFARVTIKAGERHKSFGLINIHLKAFNDKKSTSVRKENIKELAEWIKKSGLKNEVLIAGDTNLYKNDVGFEKPLVDIGFTPAPDDALTTIYKDALSERFDRFYYSGAFKDEVETTLKQISKAAFIQIVNETACTEWFSRYYDTQSLADAYCIAMFGRHVSDHLPVVITLDLKN